jgi:hypothetical protein
MARLNVSATIHPLDVNYVLVAVEDEVGEPVNGLAEKNFEVDIWASSSYAPGVFFAGPVPVVDIRDLSIVEAGYFLELRLGEVPVYDDHGQQIGANPVTHYDPLSYAIGVTRNGDHGQAIACACCSPRPRRPRGR